MQCARAEGHHEGTEGRRSVGAVCHCGECCAVPASEARRSSDGPAVRPRRLHVWWAVGARGRPQRPGPTRTWEGHCVPRTALTSRVCLRSRRRVRGSGVGRAFRPPVCHCSACPERSRRVSSALGGTVTSRTHCSRAVAPGDSRFASCQAYEIGWIHLFAPHFIASGSRMSDLRRSLTTAETSRCFF